jgi:hypothetical protein
MALPKKYEEWGKKIEREYAQAIADAALEFQTVEAEAGRVVSITDAVHHVTTKGWKQPRLEPLTAEEREFLRLDTKSNSALDNDEE